MQQRRYTRIQKPLPIIERKNAGKGEREIKIELGLEGDRPIHHLLQTGKKKRAEGQVKIQRLSTQRTYIHQHRKAEANTPIVADRVHLSERLSATHKQIDK